MRYLFCLAFLLLPVAAAPDDKPADDPHKIKPGDAPTPYTADEIRKACPEGRKDVFRIESKGQVMLRTHTWTKCDEQGADVEVAVAKEDGTPLGSDKKTATWKEMQAHASFAEADTKITEETVEVPAGKFDCWVYTVNQKMANQTVTLHMYFAKTLAGPPVKMTQEVGGTLAGSMTMTEHKVPAAGEKPAEGAKPPEKPAGG
jgi:hypothetical protein